MKKKRLKVQPSPHVQEQCGVWLSAKGRSKLQEGSNNQRLLSGTVRRPRAILTDIVIPQPKIRIGGKQSTLNKFFRTSEKHKDQAPMPLTKRNTRTGSNSVQMRLDELAGTSKKDDEENIDESDHFTSLNDFGGCADNDDTGYAPSTRYLGGQYDRLDVEQENIDRDIHVKRLKRKGSVPEISVKRMHLDILTNDSDSLPEVSLSLRDDKVLPRCQLLGVPFEVDSTGGTMSGNGREDGELTADRGIGVERRWAERRFSQEAEEPRSFVDEHSYPKVEELVCSGNDSWTKLAGPSGQHQGGQGYTLAHSSDLHECRSSKWGGCSSDRKNRVGSDINTLSEFDEFTPSILRDTLVDLDSSGDPESAPVVDMRKHGRLFRRSSALLGDGNMVNLSISQTPLFDTLDDLTLVQNL